MRKTKKSILGTYFSGITIWASLEALKNVLGKPNDTNEWHLETEEGDIFTVYRDSIEDGIIEWKISAQNMVTCILGKFDIINAMRAYDEKISK